jgi:hypothetical protein
MQQRAKAEEAKPQQPQGGNLQDVEPVGLLSPRACKVLRI